ncbi:MAG TPA: cytochrome c3 family protein [Longimicrobiales bacterium]
MEQRWGLAWGMLTVLVTLLLAAAAWMAFGGRIFAPDALSAASGEPLGGVRSHAELAGRCGACHVAPWSGSTMDARCLACHSDVRAELADSTGLHGVLADQIRCRSCHTEHHGPDGELTRLDAAALDHADFGFSLETHRTTAANRSFACADCHAPDSFAFDEARCESCHREYQPGFLDDHVAVWGADCRACHDGTAATGSAFDHARTAFPLTGAHGPVECRSCHQRAGTARAVANPPTECVGCHRTDDTHRGSMGEDCAACHSTATWEDARFDHTFPLSHGSRSPSECTVCHQNAPGDYGPYTCYGCHEHSPARVAAEHREEGISSTEMADCVRCHATGREHEGERRGERQRREHDRD